MNEITGNSNSQVLVDPDDCLKNGNSDMKIRSAYTNQSWLSPKTSNGQQSADKKPERNKATDQIRRSLSEVIRCQNLVVLSGLGTSLCVLDDSDPSKCKAPTMQDLWQRVETAYTSKNKALWTKLLASVRHPAGNKNIEELLSACKVAENFLRNGELKRLEKFKSLAEKEIRAAVDFLKSTDPLPIHRTFLQRIARRSSGKGRTKIFTTNYDLCFEHAAKSGRFVVIDGFSPTLPPTFDPVYFTYDIVRRGTDGNASAFIPNVFHLYKLHGSIDWERCESDIEKKHNTDKPLLIYPRSSKYEQAFSQPYLEMMAALQAALREPNTGLVIVGFGFNDNHIAEPVLSAIRSNLGLKVVVVDPYLESNLKKENANKYLKVIMQMMDQGDARLTFLNGTFEDIAREIPDMVAETDLEKHMVRMRGIEGDTA
ncbi:SIR2 family protein [Verminephrobacter eiseniae]|uniref:SIR2 family protein n=1 Tax=Verminephrobacter eiseniae TaxID=364317 RepID=UPI0022384917|nr:SIR2 family protein [Verminephrobacter eiseniae]MCW5284748.1 SIR2 family protein [Verminephrobacter eiseniae]MCW5302454.1 SIR2 family protein [Verminephrobacter eiseniae]MCW8178497.1 SIR2 family protein [Verminephrobacter eiseniae]MCW8189275.1 SIR2 family protein [Verminephrobacter eiseniae]